MSNKEKILARTIIVILSAVISYRIAYVDSEFTKLEDRVRVLETK
jgi:hypothetical protein